jgi:YD repeat-containing protein
LFFYAVKNGNQTGIVDSILFLKSIGDSYTALLPELNYDYDANGNITHVFESDNQVIRYYYDGLNRLVRKDNNYIDKTITYCYDKCGEKGDARRLQDRSNKKHIINNANKNLENATILVLVGGIIGALAYTMSEFVSPIVSTVLI